MIPELTKILSVGDGLLFRFPTGKATFPIEINYGVLI